MAELEYEKKHSFQSNGNGVDDEVRRVSLQYGEGEIVTTQKYVY